MKKTLIITCLALGCNAAIAQSQLPKATVISDLEVQNLFVKIQEAQNLLSNSILPGNQIQLIIRKLDTASRPIFMAVDKRQKFIADSTAKTKPINK